MAMCKEWMKKDSLEKIWNGVRLEEEERENLEILQKLFLKSNILYSALYLECEEMARIVQMFTFIRIQNYFVKEMDQLPHIRH